MVEVGESIEKFKPGDRVFIAPKVPCMKCDYCRKGHFPVCSVIKDRLPGGFAEYVLAPQALREHGTYRLADSISDDQSTFIEPLACVVRAQRLADLLNNQTVLVMGCGMSGLLHVKLAGTKNCSVIATDINPRRLEIAESLGAELTINAAEENVVERLLAENGKPVDIVILCASAMSAVEQAWQCVDKGGVVVFFTVPGPDKQVSIPINEFWTRETRIITSYYCGPPDIAEAINLIGTGNIVVDDMITHRLPLKDIAKGFQLVLQGRESIKVIVKPNF